MEVVGEEKDRKHTTFLCGSSSFLSSVGATFLPLVVIPWYLHNLFVVSSF